MEGFQISFFIFVLVKFSDGLPFGATYYFPMETIDGTQVKGGSVALDSANLGALLNTEEGLVGNALKLDGCISVAETLLPDMGNCLTALNNCNNGFVMIFWMKIGDRDQLTYPVYTKTGYPGARQGIRLVQDSHLKLILTMTAPTHYYTTDPVQVVRHKWYMIGITWHQIDGVILMIDDIIEDPGAISQTGNAPGDTLYLGCNHAQGYLFDGALDELLLWNMGKSRAEMEMLRMEIIYSLTTYPTMTPTPASTQTSEFLITGKFYYVIQARAIEGVIYTTTVTHKKVCLGICLRHDVCRSVNWDENKNNCTLLDMDSPLVDQGSINVDNVHLYRKEYKN